MTADPEFGPFLESLSDAHRRRQDRERFNEIVADLEPLDLEEMPWRLPCPEPPLWRALLDALWGIVWPRGEEKR